MSILDRAIALCEKDQETYRVSLPSGDEIEFRHVAGPDEVSKIEAAAQQMIETIKKRATSKEILAVGVKDPMTLAQAHFLKALYVASYRRVETEDEGGEIEVTFEPEDDTPTFVDYLNMAKKVPFAFRTLWSRVDDEMSGRAALARREAVEEARKKSRPTPTGSPSSEPEGTSGDGIPES